MNETIRVVFFNLRFRLYVLRIIILSALVATVTSISIYSTYDWYYPIKWTALLAFITVHHILVAGRPRFLLYILDLLLAIGEAIATGFYVTQRRQDDVYFKPWAPEVVIYHAASIYILLACLSLFTIFRLANVAWSPENVARSYEEILKLIRRPLDMFEKLWTDEEDCPTISTLFIGRTFWREHFPGESKIVRILRGLLGLGMIVLLFFYAMLHLVYDPIRETSLTPVHEYRTTIPPIDYQIDPMVWNIVIGPYTFQDESVRQEVIGAITVTPLQDPTADCELIPLPPIQARPKVLPPITYQCHGQRFENGTFDTMPESILLTINYTTLPQFLNVVVGLFNQTSVGFDIVPKSASLSVVQGVNLIAAISLNIREVFVNPGIAAFGMYQTTKPIWIGTVTSIYPDPFSDITRDPAVSTLRLYLQDPDPTELIILSDQRDNSVLAGFSALGGLWTSLCGLFVLMFGGSMLNYLYGSKDISVLGAAHSFNHTTLREEFQKKYPGIAKEEKDGILALLSDHIIDLNFLKNSSSSSKEPDVEKGRTDTDSSNSEAKTRNMQSHSAIESPELDPVEKHSLLVNS